ncbi:hypothetical protein BaRGS_00011403 [Batillaria attramentaria]|uniref:Uncharacterized protein n=1 Tax=Batillaria attramentaria TaxID=370345 RepID=A0ABD0LD11_9CAEN
MEQSSTLSILWRFDSFNGATHMRNTSLRTKGRQKTMPAKRESSTSGCCRYTNPEACRVFSIHHSLSRLRPRDSLFPTDKKSEHVYIHHRQLTTLVSHFSRELCMFSREKTRSYVL